MRKAALYIGAGAAFIAAAAALEMRFIHIEAATPAGKLLFLLLLNLNVLALLGLVALVGKSLVTLYLEHRRRVLGYRFKTKIVTFAVILTAIPAGLLFLLASGLGTNYIDRLFTPQFRQPIESSVRVAEKLYEMERNRALQYAEMVRSGFQPPSYYKVSRLEEMPEEPSAAVKAAFEGQPATEVISGEGSDTIRAAIPADEEAPGAGVIVVESSVPPEITENVERIRTAYEDYLRLEWWKFPLKLNYLLMLGFFTLIILFTSLWVSLRIAGWITEPVRSLAVATEEVAGGNLAVSVASERRDEMGLLIESFNRMVKELRDGKESLQKAYLESDRRRLLMQNIVDNIQSGVISLDSRGVVRAINQSACSILGVKEREVLGRDYREMLANIRSEELEKLITSINIKTFTRLDREVRAVMGGRKARLRISITGLRGDSGDYLGLLVVVDDLSDLIKAQRALAWQEVARRMAHEIKNPLTPIKLSTERMLKKWHEQDGDFAQTFERSTNTIIREVDSLKRLVDEFSRLGKMPAVNKTPTDIVAVTEEVAALYRDYRDISISVEAPAGGTLADLDGEQFKRVLINLFENALEAVKDGGGNIAVRIRPEEGMNRLFIEVADDGPGMADDVKERLFQPYFSTKKHGTGLGLAIADKIISEHNGHIRVRDNVPRGSVFTIELPLKEA
ncbi:MAG: ATP-binding protein [Thermodesulfovibrionales bacterium]